MKKKKTKRINKKNPLIIPSTHKKNKNEKNKFLCIKQFSLLIKNNNQYYLHYNKI